MHIVSWNVRHVGLETRLAEVVARLVDSGADILALQEVSLALLDSTAGLLETYGYGSHVNSIARTPEGPYGRKPFGCIVASKWPTKPGPSDWRLGAPYPESFARAVVSAPTGPLDVTSVHIPNGAGNGWKKVATFHVLAQALAEPGATRRIVAGDFNEPKELLLDGSIVTFSEVRPEDKGHRLWTDNHGQTGDLHEWEEAVQSVLGVKPAHRLLDVQRVVYGGMFTPKTHFAAGRTARWFDHILVSPEFHIEKCGVYSEWLETGVSDHAGVWAEIE